VLSCGVDSEALRKWQARPSFRKPRQYPSEAFRFVEAQSFSAQSSALDVCRDGRYREMERK
ncbi:hypothetical protein ACCT09_20905, partial [Rhizobium ruizarguesonis]